MTSFRFLPHEPRFPGLNPSTERFNTMRALFRCLIAPAFIAAATPVLAQQPEPLRLGQPVAASLQAGDPTMMDQGPFRVYSFDARGGQRYIFTLDSDDFDAFLSVHRRVGAITEVLATDDDGGGDLNARLRWLAPESGTYLVVAHALTPDSYGQFRLAVEEGAPPRPAVPQPARIGEAVNSTLHAGSGSLEVGDGEIFHDIYVLDARYGQEFIITMDSDDFDAYLEFGPMQADSMQVTDTNDDGGEGTNSRLRVLVPADGRYAVRARGFSSDQFGRYSLLIREAPSIVPRALVAGRDHEGSLEDEDQERWVYQGTAGQAVRVSMRSTNFDTVLELGIMRDGRYEALTTNDDEGPDSTDSVVEYTLPETGEYIITARAFSSHLAGQYTVRLEVLDR
jgi:hypothetical protein